MCPLYKVGEPFFLFLNLNAVFSDLTPENLAINESETVQIHFLSEFFGLLSSRNFATMAIWRNDFSTLSVT